MEDIERLTKWLYEYLFMEEKIHMDRVTEYWNRLNRNPHDLRAAAEYFSAVANMADFVEVRNKLFTILDTFHKGW